MISISTKPFTVAKYRRPSFVCAAFRSRIPKTCSTQRKNKLTSRKVVYNLEYLPRAISGSVRRDHQGTGVVAHA